MSMYTTGEIAKLCGVSVRTVQYYDARGILIPSQLSEGGRRLYTEEDLKKLRIICFLREVGIPINGIRELFLEEDPGSVISILLEQHEQVLRQELEERQEKLNLLELMQKELKKVEHFSVACIGDVAYLMENRRKLHRVRAIMVLLGIVIELIEATALFLWIFKGIWWPALAGLPLVLGITIWVVNYYFKKVEYICSKCHMVFKPGFREMFFASHTPTTRKLTCTYCGHKGFCVEVYGRGGKTVTNKED